MHSTLLCVLCALLAATAAARAPLHGSPRGVLRAFAGPSPSPDSDAELHMASAPQAEVLFIFSAPGALEAALSALEVVLDDSSRPDVTGQVLRRFTAVPGLSAMLSAAAIDLLRDALGSEFAEFDIDLHVAPVEASAASADVQAAGTEVVQDARQFWNLDRSDQWFPPLDEQFTSPSNAGAGVDVYIVDSGIRTTHVDFGDRAVFSASFNGDSEDCHGHGTHVAGIVAGARTGVAKGATVHSVKVLGCTGEGSLSQVISGLDHIMTQVSQQANPRPTIVNLSLGAPVASASSLLQYTNAAVDAGITLIVAAGNSLEPACNLLPAASDAVITVAASTSVGTFSTSFSNFGECIDIVAPGSSIISTSRTGDNNHERRTGTSMAAPLVAGIAAIYLSDHPSATPQQVSQALLCAAVPDALRDVPSATVNLLAHLITPANVAGDCLADSCVDDAGCYQHGICLSGTCVCDAGFAGFNCNKTIPITYLSQHSGVVDSTLAGADDYLEHQSPDITFVIDVPSGSRLQLATCSSQTLYPATVRVSASPPTQLHASPAAEASADDPRIFNCQLTDSLAPIDLSNRAGEHYITVSAQAGTSSPGAFRLAWRVTTSAEAGNCEVGQWSAWGACSEVCGQGSQSRTRAVLDTNPTCSYLLTQSRNCLAHACTCELSQWGEWAACSSPCGEPGTRTRQRSVTSGTATYCPGLEQEEVCQGPASCSCSVSEWGDFTSCSQACGGGQQARSRSVVHPGWLDDCPELEQTLACNTSPCSCSVTAWGEWGPCSTACGYGSRNRTREVVSGTLAVCPPLLEEEGCEAPQLCPGGCEVSQWSEWGACSAACGGGTSVRSRSVVTQGEGCPELDEEKSCNTLACSDCEVSAWGSWSSCVGSCGSSTRARSRSVVVPQVGGAACPSLTDEEVCTLPDCVFTVVSLAMNGYFAWSDDMRSTVATRVSVIGGSAVPHLTAASVSVALASGSGRRLTAGVTLEVTVPVATVAQGRSLATAVLDDASGGGMASTLATNHGITVQVVVDAIDVQAQDGHVVEVVLEGTSGNDGGSSAASGTGGESSVADPASEELFDEKMVLVVAVALAALVVMCLFILVIAIRHNRNQPTRVESITYPSRRGAGQRGGHGASQQVVPVGPRDFERAVAMASRQASMRQMSMREAVRADASRRSQGSQRSMGGSQATVRGSQITLHGSQISMHGSQMSMHGSQMSMRNGKRGSNRGSMRGSQNSLRNASQISLAQSQFGSQNHSGRSAWQ